MFGLGWVHNFDIHLIMQWTTLNYWLGSYLKLASMPLHAYACTIWSYVWYENADFIALNIASSQINAGK